MSWENCTLSQRRIQKLLERGWDDSAEAYAKSNGYSLIDDIPISLQDIERVEIKLAQAKLKLDEISNNGQLVVLYGLSQMGKDFYASKLEDLLINQILRIIGITFYGEEKDFFNSLVENKDPIILNTFPIEYAEVYKTRKPRYNDKPSLHAVETENEIPEEFDVRATVNDGQVCAYSTSDIQSKLKNKKIVIVTTTSLEMVKKLKQVAGDKQMTIKIVSKKKTPEEIAEVERERYKDNPQAAEAEIQKRINAYDAQYEEYSHFVDYDFRIINLPLIHKFIDTEYWNDVERKLEELAIPARYIIYNHFAEPAEQLVEQSAEQPVEQKAKTTKKKRP